MLAQTPKHELVDRTKLEGWRRLLLNAADWMETHGFARRKLYNMALGDGVGPVCARGAIMRANGRIGNHQLWPWEAGPEIEADNKLGKFLVRTERLTGFFGEGGVPYWNNDVATGKDEVVAVMRECALEGIDVY